MGKGAVMREDSSDVDMLKQKADKDPENAAAWLNYGLALLENRRSDEAVQALEKASKLNPDAVEARYHLGNALAENGRHEEAAKQFWSLACDDPEMRNPLSVPGLSALMRMAECQGELGHWPETRSAQRFSR